MRLEDWREAAPEALRALYDAEQLRWMVGLGWSLGPSWALVEPARASGQLPGFLARDARGAVVGWTFFLLHDDLLQVGALVSDSAAVVRGLLDAILDSPEAARARSVTAFLFPRSRVLAPALVRQRFVVKRALYLRRSLTGHEAHGAPAAVPVGGTYARVRPWTPADAVAALRLLARAYHNVPGAACFAPHGRLGEWAHYLGQLTRTAVCGACMPEASFVAADPMGNDLLGLVLTTRISATTAHVAQLAVDPSAARHGLGRRLLAAACAAARAAGCETVTLLVAAENQPACGLYRGAGFVQAETFVWAVRTVTARRSPLELLTTDQPFLSTSAAPCLGATTRR
jgi:ribosomal protein S18 acetylase RimI-like enzyme